MLFRGVLRAGYIFRLRSQLLPSSTGAVVSTPNIDKPLLRVIDALVRNVERLAVDSGEVHVGDLLEPRR